MFIYFCLNDRNALGYTLSNIKRKGNQKRKIQSNMSSFIEIAFICKVRTLHFNCINTCQ